MTDIKLLEMLSDFYGVQKNVTCFMLWAIEDFERGKEDQSYSQLFLWCEAKDDREEIWKKFKSDFPRATMLKEGVGYD